MHGSLRRPPSWRAITRRRSHLPVAAVSTFARNALGPTRSVIDADGTFWQVCEVEYALDRRRGRSLVFESDASVRRVRHYPDTWFDLPDAELVRLVEST